MAAKVGSRDKGKVDASTKMRKLPPPVCMYCERVKSLSHTKALFAVIEEKMILCYNCEEGLLEGK